MAEMEFTKVEIMLPKANRQEAEELAEFLENITEEGSKNFFDMIRTANILKGVLDGSIRRAG